MVFSLTSRAEFPSWVRSTNAVEFFTNLSSRLLSAGGYRFDAGDIPVYTNNTFAFSPDVHRLLQVAANIYDASTNRADRGGPDFPFLPSVFRPTFAVNPVGDILISGWIEVTNAGVAELSKPLDLSDPNHVAQISSVGFFNGNLYDVPWIIGVKKGFPSFNEFAMQSVAQVTRRLQMRRPTFTSRPNATNQMFIVGISNVLAVEAWNAYPSNYSRAVDILVANDIKIEFTFTNDPALDLRGGRSTIHLNLAAATNVAANDWQGYGTSLSVPNIGSFVVPLATNLIFLPNSVYRTESGETPFFTANTNVGSNLYLGFEQTGRFPLPDFQFAVTNRLRFILHDHDTQRVIDYVNIGGLIGARNLSAVLATVELDSTENALWSTNRVGGVGLENTPLGIMNQIQVALGNLDIPNWNNYGVGQAAGTTKYKEIDQFRSFMGFVPIYSPGTLNTNLTAVVPFTPTRRTSQYLSWQANDPFVHFLRQDLMSSDSSSSIRRELPNGPVHAIANIGQLNQRFTPWGGYPPTTLPSATAYVSLVKDPMVRSSENWNCAPHGLLSVEWLGKVHRGTPWQTLYLKSADVNSSTWQSWLGGWDPIAAQRARPLADRPLIASLVSLLNTNHPGTLLSVNSPDTNAWRQALDGLVVLGNASTDAELLSNPPLVRFETNVMTATSSQADDIANAILQTRGGKTWTSVGDVLATPAMSEGSPWLNLTSAVQLQRGISDEAYEKIASQLLPCLRMDSLGKTAATVEGHEIEFTGYDGFPYAIEVSGDLTQWSCISTNIPTNGVFRFADPDAGCFGARYYRSRLLP